ncbi:helix-turn-helix transcriptional regulator [Staphylococcus simulans]|uniref:helix-turn-helix domain-containing protein n=1 Tax=Staphylococcus simulans TaxID=1286 RepID=UPI0021CFF865|nr:helix-turn-helix transcriptional regulator [Staphylococcus simulans]UXR34708.1 helix-turn-helix transcriptional regulator [Staphylococcus simulans]
MIIVSNLRVKMAEKGLTIKEVHKKTNLSRTTISNLYNGYSDGIKFQTLEALCELLKCSPNDLLKVIKINATNISFSEISNNKNNEYYYRATYQVTINNITKEVITDLIATQYDNNAPVLEGEIEIPDYQNIISIDDFEISLNNIEKVNNYLEKYVLNAFSKSDFANKLFDLPVYKNYSF